LFKIKLLVAFSHYITIYRVAQRSSETTRNTFFIAGKVAFAPSCISHMSCKESLYWNYFPSDQYNNILQML